MSKRKAKRSSGPAPVGCGARVVAGGALLELIEAYGDAYQAAAREVYRRCILGSEPWFAKRGAGRAPSGVRAELIGRGWSQREATSIHTFAAAAQESAIESRKLALERAEDDLEVVEEKFTKAKEALPKAETAKRIADLKRQVSGLARRRDILTARVARHRRAIEAGDVRVCFGGRKLAVAGNDPVSHGYESREEWREQWDRARGGGFLLHGDSESVAGNYSARVHLAQGDGDSDFIMLRVPGFLRRSTSDEGWVQVPVKGFANNRSDLAAAIAPDVASHAGTLAAWERSKELRDMLTPLVETGVSVPVPAPSKFAPSLKTGSPVTVRFYWSERKGAWYVEATCNRVAAPPVNRSWASVLGVDLNPDHLAWCVIDRQGNPRRWGRIDIDLTGSAGSNEDSLGVACKSLAAIASEHGAAIAVENLDFTRSRSALRYTNPATARQLSSFAYNKFFSILASRCARQGVQVVSVNPAWTSVLGQANYAGVYGVSVDQGAACVIARRALGLSSRVRPAVCRQVPRCVPGGKAHVLRDVGKMLRSGPHARGRSSTWDADGFCLRRSPPLVASMSSGALQPLPSRETVAAALSGLASPETVKLDLSRFEQVQK